MTSFTEHNLRQKAVYWGAPIADGYGGFSWADPIEISCRWEDLVSTVIGKLGSATVSQSRVQVARDLEEEGMLFLGTLNDLDSGDFNDPVSAGAFVIIRFDKIPNIKGTAFFRRAYL